MSDAHDVGLVLKTLRERAGLSQRQLAEELNVQQPAVARWETGGVRMPLNRIEQILKHFGYGIDYDLRAIPIDVALNEGVPFRIVRRRSQALEQRKHPRRVRSGSYEFSVNEDAPWCVDMWDVQANRRCPGAFAVYPEHIDEIVPHPDGILIRFGCSVGKITTTAKRHDDGSLVFAYCLAHLRDLELAGVADETMWSRADNLLSA